MLGNTESSYAAGETYLRVSTATTTIPIQIHPFYTRNSRVFCSFEAKRGSKLEKGLKNMLSSKHLARVVSKMLRMILQRCSPLEKLDHLGYAALPEFEIIEGALIANEIAHLGNNVFLICQRSILRAYPLFS